MFYAHGLILSSVCMAGGPGYQGQVQRQRFPIGWAKQANRVPVQGVHQPGDPSTKPHHQSLSALLMQCDATINMCRALVTAFAIRVSLMVHWFDKLEKDWTIKPMNMNCSLLGAIIRYSILFLTWKFSEN
jgi:hypothetical protein